MIQHLAQLREQALEDSKKMVTLFNPDNNDFTLKILGIDYTVPSHDFKDFPFPIARLIKKHLADKVYFSRDDKLSYEDGIKKVLDEIEVIK